MGSSSKNRLLTVEWLQQTLSTLNTEHSVSQYVIAYSGGVDSRVLLQLCADAGLPLRAVHVHHGLQAEADDWVQHCQQVCDALNIELQVCHVDAVADRGESPEAVAREVRYRALDSALQTGEVLLLAQHKDDQAETVLLQMLRGAGPAGLSAMPPASRSASGHRMLRPLLDVSRQQIVACAESHHLDWIEDPSNQHTRYRRNAVRHEVLPAIRQHWPQAVDSLAQVAQQQQRSRRLLDDLAHIDLAACAPGRAWQAEVIEVSALQRLDRERCFNLLRYWLHSHGSRPNRACITQIIDSVLGADDDAAPVVRWNGHELRRFGGRLYLLTPRASSAPDEHFHWQPEQPLPIAALDAELVSHSPVSAGLDSALLNQTLQVRFRCGGESIRPRGSCHRRSVKKLLQQADVPPWQRQRIPLLYHGDDLLAVCGYWLADEYCVTADEAGWMPVLQ